MYKVGIIIGSLRKDSYNRKLGEYIIEKYRKLAEFTEISIEKFPLFNEDLENNIDREVIMAKELIKEQDGVIIISPEYNYSIPGPLKNALDWFSRKDYPLMKKPYLLMGASSGSIGTARCQRDLREVLNSGAFKMYSPPANEFLLARIQDKTDEEGNLIDPETIKRLDKKIESFLDYISLIKNKDKRP